jgi:ATP-dependent phosphofructokinase / diphosphate-dependent phosphofructokinase
MTSIARMGILVGGGPAPGINSVISAATIRASLEGIQVVGIEDGFEWIMKGDLDHVRRLDIDAVSRLHFRGGSFIGIARANPTKSSELLETTVRSLEQLGVDGLITIGGDDTALSATMLERQAKGRVRVVHVPKSIDNDLDLPPHVDTFGYQTARHVGVDILKNLMVDARTTSRWYFAIAMGRKAGHLALGIGKAAAATLTLIPEEFPPVVKIRELVDTLAGAIIKRLAMGRKDGIAVIAEGLALRLDPADLEGLDKAERDAHGHVRISDLEIGEILRHQVEDRLESFGVEMTIVSKDIGYELRSADPIPYDMEYTRDLGYCAAKYLIEGGNAAVVSMQAGRFVPIPLADMHDDATGRSRVRMVDIESTRYAIARRYMLRLRREDFSDPDMLSGCAAVAKITPEEFRRQFEYLVEEEPPALVLHPAPAERAP